MFHSRVLSIAAAFLLTNAPERTAAASPSYYAISFEVIDQTVNSLPSDVYSAQDDVLSFTVRLRITNNNPRTGYFDAYSEITKGFLVPVETVQTQNITVSAYTSTQLLVTVTTTEDLELGEDYASYNRCYEISPGSDTKIDHGQATWEEL
ncbi:MAG: hypothetical protein NXI32_09995 [bacterium]|nr:hypothetical protein [bacterium]